MLAATEFNYKWDMGKIGKPVDRTEWGMSPQTVNAYYNPMQNEIVFPAAILQPPFFDPKADDAANYGGIGAVIGHEMTHGYDDQGSRFGPSGNFENWWTPADAKGFASRTDKLVNQFSGYEAAARPEGQRQADPGRKHRRSRRSRHRLRRDEQSHRRHAGPEDRRPDAATSTSSSTGRPCGAASTRPDYLKVIVNTNEHAPAGFPCHRRAVEPAGVRGGVPVQGG